MCKLLMSINPEHVDNILTGVKKFEFRKTKCREKIDGIVIYSTAPIMKVVGEVAVTDIIEGTPQKVWSHTSFAAGIDKSYYDQYYHGRKTAVAYVLGEIKQYNSPKYLSDYGIKTAPQSYVYVRG
jgi:predicted transcriptional regulator